VPTNNIISRADAGALMPEQVSNEMLTNLADKAQGSAARKLFRSVPVSRGQVRFPVLSALPIAYWVTGDTGLKQTTEVNWANKFLNIEELAVIVPIPESVLDDAGTPIWDAGPAAVRGGRRAAHRQHRVLRRQRSRDVPDERRGGRDRRRQRRHPRHHDRRQRR
jgi:hypothetical protein